ncbi:hypothetical protein [Phenylobacterium sp.]|uniref:hypothetical protein n=1 Tax=Phenylobacterium sp. TaxID=1871053 RepID=UPI00392398FD
MTADDPDPGPSPTPTHLYDAVSAQRDEILGGFGEQREALIRAVEEQRLAAMPRHMRLAALSPAQASAEIVQTLRQLVAKEVTRQLHLAIASMMAERAQSQGEAPGKQRVAE